MDSSHIKKILEEVASGAKSPSDALLELRDFPYADLEIAKHDAHRPLRNGFSEVILCEGKELGHLIRIVEELVSRGLNIFGTKANPSQGESLTKSFPKCDYDPISRTFRFIQCPIEPIAGRLAILCAGTADLPVAEEARRTAEFFGIEAIRHYDVGVAGLHRLIGCVAELREMDVAIVVAGMEGALPSVVGGLVPIPVIACPTSIGYGASFNGIAALLSMLNSCSEGISVVNIDNGFGAACSALRILRRRIATR